MEDLHFNNTIYTPVFCTLRKGGAFKNIVVLMANFDTESQVKFVQELGRRNGVFADANEQYTDFRMDFGKYLLCECASFEWFSSIEYAYDWSTGVIEISGEDFDFSGCHCEKSDPYDDLMAELDEFLSLEF